MIYETHPLQPFLPQSAKVLFLGSFPPPRSKWSMEFFYPNWINDFWRIIGILFYDDRSYFEVEGQKKFDKDSIVEFCSAKGFAFFDSATKVCRLKDNASDNFLEILEATDVPSLLAQIPSCRAIITTGGKSSEELASILSVDSVPAVGACVEVVVGGSKVTWYRVPSSSRAFPMKIEKKADVYRSVLSQIGLF